jgi:D-3-phosphoglycerate dehydrogenase
MSMILALSRNIPQAYASMKAGKWDRNKFSGIELHGKTLGIIGFGRIGSTVAKFCKAFNMNILVYDPFITSEIAEQKGVRLVELEAIVKESDFITVHIPKTSETTNLIGEAELKKMKKSVRLINCARGGIIDEAALAKALKEGAIAGCALDVFDTEPLPADSPLLQLDNCILTPHLGASTSEAQINVAIEIAETIRNAMTGKGIVNAANFPSVDADAYKVLAPYIDLSVRMGKFSGQLITGRVTEVKVITSGIMNKHKVAPLTLSFVNGLLKPILGEGVNYINALDVAKERGIDVQEIISNKEEEFVNCIKAEIKTEKEVFRLCGTLSSNSQPRIVKVNDVYVEATPDGHILFIKNSDKPGLVGAIGTILGDAKVNIAGITLGREAQDGVAVSLINVDSDIPEHCLERIESTKNVLFAKLLKI